MVESVKAPDEAYDYLAKNNTVESIIKYAINWKHITEKIYLKPWLASQVEEAYNDEPFISYLEENIKYYKTNKYDSIMTELLAHFQNNGPFLKYVGDMKTWKVNEYWQRYNETFKLKTGDCEDGAILIYVAARICGVPANRLLLMTGDVEGGGHCWLAYRPERDPWNLVFLDWCYWSVSKPIIYRLFYIKIDNEIVGSFNKYHKMWWCFNEEGTYLRFKPTYNAQI